MKTLVGSGVARSLAAVLVMVCCHVDVKAHLRFERGLGRAMLREPYGRPDRRQLGRLGRTLIRLGCVGVDSRW
jgi:hypothetical protein